MPPRKPPKLGLPLLPPGDVSKPDPTPKPRGTFDPRPGITIDLKPKPRVGVLGKPGIAEAMLAAVERGSKVNIDLSDKWDYWAWIELPIDAGWPELADACLVWLEKQGL